MLSDDELRLIWRAAYAIGWPFGPMVQTLILTLQRRDEVAGMSKAAGPALGYPKRARQKWAGA